MIRTFWQCASPERLNQLIHLDKRTLWGKRKVQGTDSRGNESRALKGEGWLVRNGNVFLKEALIKTWFVYGLKRIKTELSGKEKKKREGKQSLKRKDWDKQTYWTILSFDSSLSGNCKFASSVWC